MIRKLKSGKYRLYSRKKDPATGKVRNLGPVTTLLIDERGMRNTVRKREDIAVVLLDVDGTLIDSNNAHAQSWVDVGTEFGFDISFDEVRRLIGMGGDKVLPRLTGLQEESTAGERILERRGEIFRGKYLPVLSPFPRTRELLKRMRADGFELVVASSAGKKDLEALLKQAGIADLLATKTSSDERSIRSDPDIVIAALRRARGTRIGRSCWATRRTTSMPARRRAYGLSQSVAAAGMTVR